MGEYRPIKLIRLVDTLARLERSLAETRDHEGDFPGSMEGHREAEDFLREREAVLIAVQRTISFHLRSLKEGGDCDG